MNHPKAIGDRSTLAMMLALSDAGYAVLVPFGENTRYDLVIDDGTSLKRVQCKTGRLRHGAVRFAARSSYAHHPNPKMVVRDYLGQIDYFGVYCPDTGGAYLIPVGDAPVRAAAHCESRVPRMVRSERSAWRRIMRSLRYRSGLLENLARALVRVDLPLDPLQRVVDRLRVAVELLGHVLIGRAFEVQAERVGLELRQP
jgi:hypothetical protein